MWGLFFATAFGGLRYLFGAEPEQAFIDGATFLFVWYLVTSIVGLAFVAAMCFLVTGGATVAGAATGSRFGPGGILGGGLLGLALGGGFTVFIMAIALVGAVMRVVGAYLLQGAVEHQDAIWVWDTTQCIIGAVLVVVPRFFSLSSRGKTVKSESHNTGL